jgi:hypothetical protein
MGEKIGNFSALLCLNGLPISWRNSSLCKSIIESPLPTICKSLRSPPSLSANPHFLCKPFLPHSLLVCPHHRLEKAVTLLVSPKSILPLSHTWPLSQNVPWSLLTGFSASSPCSLLSCLHDVTLWLRRFTTTA